MHLEVRPAQRVYDVFHVLHSTWSYEGVSLSVRNKLFTRSRTELGTCGVVDA